MTPWIAYHKPLDHAVGRLICLPFAGGAASVFRLWQAALPGLEVLPVQLPGREGRLAEAPIDRLEPLIDELGEALMPFLDRPFAVFGHSMGAMVAHRLATRLEAAGHRPRALLVSAAWAPHVPRRRAPIHHLPDAAFLEALGAYGGIPDAVLADRELMALFLPALRADFTLAEGSPLAPARPLGCPIVAYRGSEDAIVAPEEVAGWQALTDEPLLIREVAGGHFFLTTARPALLEQVRADLAQVGL